MRAMLRYIQLQLKIQYSNDKSNKKGNIFSMIMSVILFVVIMGLIYTLSEVLIKSFQDVSPREIAIIFVFVIELMLTFVAIGLQIKHIFKPFDVQITARFPLSDTMLYVASLILVYLNLLIFSLFSFFPIMLIFSLASGIFSGAYVGLLILATIFAPFVPFAISLLVAVPIMFVMAMLENHNYIRLFLFVLCIIGFFVLYDYILNMLADYFIYKRIDKDTANLWNNLVFGLNSIYNPFFYVKEMLFADMTGYGIGIIFLSALLIGIVGSAISIPVFKYVHKSAREGVRSIFNKKTKLTNDSLFTAMFKKEFKEILRTKLYSYFYLGVAVATPVMVFFCDRLVVSVGEAQLGTSVAMGASVLVLSAFMTLINSFSGSAINKEAERFYITKIIPIKFKNQLLIKGLLTFLISVGALIISCFVIVELEFVSIEEMFVLFTSEMIMALAMIFTGFNLNLKFVNLNSRSNGDTDESNVTIVMIIGTLISALLGALTIFTCYFVNSRYSYIAIYIIPIICMVVNVIVFTKNADKKYFNIEPR